MERSSSLKLGCSYIQRPEALASCAIIPVGDTRKLLTGVLGNSRGRHVAEGAPGYHSGPGATQAAASSDLPGVGGFCAPGLLSPSFSWSVWWDSLKN